jgi:hypothetical protein
MMMTEMMKAVQLHAFGGPENLLYEETPGHKWATTMSLCICRQPASTRLTGTCATAFAHCHLNGGPIPLFHLFWGRTSQALLRRSVKM